MTYPTKFIERMTALCGDDWRADQSAPPHRGVRVNTLKCAVPDFLALTDMKLTPTPFAASGFELLGDEKVGADPLHHAGAYYMQEPSAMSAVTALSPQPGERVLDLCAAPGGKSTQIAAAIGRSGLLWCNEYVRARAQALLQNLERCGVPNAVVTSMDTARLTERLPRTFDAVLADVPCSGEGMFRKEPAALTEWSEDNIHLCADRGATILDAAARAVRLGGRLLLSTCTFAPEENECQVAAFLRRHPDFELVPLYDLPFGQPAFSWEAVRAFSGGAPAPNADLTLCRRIFPKHGGEGHFLTLFRRTADTEPDGGAVALFTPPTDRDALSVTAALQERFKNPPTGTPVRFGDRWQLIPAHMPALKSLPVLHAGITAVHVKSNRLEPTHALYAAAGRDAASLVTLLPGDDRLTAFLRGEPVPVSDTLRGWTAVCVGDVPLSFGKAVAGTLKNHYPKGLRLLG